MMSFCGLEGLYLSATLSSSIGSAHLAFHGDFLNCCCRWSLNLVELHRSASRMRSQNFASKLVYRLFSSEEELLNLFYFWRKIMGF